MRTGKKAGAFAVAVAALLLWVVAGAGTHPAADERNYQQERGTTAETSPVIQYQARLTDPSTGESVADGTYTMVFRLYSVATGGTALWTETKDVPVQAGLFSAALGDTIALSQDILNGQQLWLGIKVGGDAEATPRQPIRPAAYAVGLVPGAIVEAGSSLPILSVHNTGGGEGLHVEGTASIIGNLTVSGALTGGTHGHSGADITSGTVAEAFIDGALTRDGEIMPIVLASAGAGSGLDADLLDGQQASAFANTIHEHSGADITTGSVPEPRIDPALTRDGEVMPIVLAGGGPDSGLNADLLDGQQASAFASTIHEHSGADISSGTVAELRIDPALARDDEVMPIVLASDGTGSGLDADMVDGAHMTAFARATHEHSGADISTGTVAEPRIDAAITRDSEVMSRVLAGDGPGSGLNADYLDGYHSLAFASYSHAHWGASWAGTGTGLSLSSSNDIGLNSSGEWYGVWGEIGSSGSAGVLGYAPSTTGSVRGIWGFTYSTGGTGVRGDASASSGTNYGVYGRSNSPSGYGVFGSTDDNYGVYGEAFATTGTNFGAYGQSHSTGGRGVWGWASATTGSGIGVGGGSAAGGYGLYTGNNLYVGGSCIGCTSVFIATNASEENLLVGDAVVATGVGPVLLGHSAPVLQVRRATPDDVSVLGVVYRRGEFYAASDREPEVGDIVQPGDGDVAPGEYVMVITSGLGQVRVEPGLVALAPGQSLTIAGVAGRATAAGTDTAPDLVFARAVETEPDADGLVWALIDPR